MNRDTKLAIVLAPFLLIGGYIASDYYIENYATEPRIFALSPQGQCTPFSGDCILQSGDFQINITDQQGVTRSNTSYPVDTVAISLVYSNGKEIIYGLDKTVNEQYWERKTDLRTAFTINKNAEKMRVVVQRKGNTYLSEFIPEV